MSPDDEITLDPRPAYVVKTLLVSGKHQGTKVFINICTDPAVPEPQDGYGELMIQKIQNDEDYIVPIVVSQERQTTDKANRTSLVYDCCMHPRVVQETLKNNGFRLIVIETCLELVEENAGAELNRDFSLPKMLQKGELQQVVIKRKDLEHKQESLTSGMDDIAKMVQEQRLKEDKKPQGILKKSKSPLIEVVSEQSNGIDDIGSEEEEEEGELSYTVTKRESGPKYEIEVAGLTRIANPRLSKSGRVVLLKRLRIPLPVETDHIEPYFVTSCNKLYIFVY
ncbi:hypothetical protein TRVA0_024S01332 [Trichomonascus vanleenenianus]|uniref:Pih1p n=1 Tax=Trichomonascus vanleenenianus TaxID=2268995 RepID=UPI003ECB72B2